MSLLQSYINARHLLSNPSQWTQGVGAVDNRGRPVDADGEDACAWCVVGAVYKSGGGFAWDSLDAIARARGYESAVDFNDHTDHEAVLGLLDEAIELQKAKADA